MPDFTKITRDLRSKMISEYLLKKIRSLSPEFHGHIIEKELTAVQKKSFHEGMANGIIIGTLLSVFFYIILNF